MPASSPSIAASPPDRPGYAAARRRRRQRIVRRAMPLVLLAAAAFAGGAVTGAGHRPDEIAVAERFAAAWERGDYARMHAQLSPAAQRKWPLRRFTRLYRQAAGTATVRAVEAAGRPREAGGVVTVPLRTRTQVFGVLRAPLRLPFAPAGDDGGGIAWDRHLVLAGMRRGEKLRREIVAPPRGALEARDGSVMARGPERRPEEGVTPAGGIVGSVGPIPPERAAEFQRLGYPDDATVGLSGLEREFETRLAGRFGGLLLSSGRVLARADERQGAPVRTTIDLGVQETAVAAIGARLGGVAVLRPRSGEVLALAGIAYSAPQPPGSTFKIVTLAAALEEKVVEPTARFPVETFTTIEGVELENANGESCGGTLANSFAHSCNSVFAPLGARVGAERLVAAAEAFGFNEPPTLKGAAPSTIPDPEALGDDLGVGSTAIGQGKVLATPLLLAGVAATIANRGTYARPTLLRGARTRRTRTISAGTARTIGRFMRRVVSDGTGGGAAIAGVSVAGKTGTAELRDTTPEETPTPSPGAPPPPPVEEDRTDTDAWFVAYAPAARPRVAVAVLLVGEGAGGETAAPVAREVLLSALKRGR